MLVDGIIWLCIYIHIYIYTYVVWFHNQHVLCLQNVNSQARIPTLRTPNKEAKHVFGAPMPTVYIHSDPKTSQSIS